MATTGTQTLALSPRKHEVTLATVATTGAQTLATLFVISNERVFNSRFSDRFKKT